MNREMLVASARTFATAGGAAALLAALEEFARQAFATEDLRESVTAARQALDGGQPNITLIYLGRCLDTAASAVLKAEKVVGRLEVRA